MAGGAGLSFPAIFGGFPPFFAAPAVPQGAIASGFRAFLPVRGRLPQFRRSAAGRAGAIIAVAFPHSCASAHTSARGRGCRAWIMRRPGRPGRSARFGHRRSAGPACRRQPVSTSQGPQTTPDRPSPSASHAHGGAPGASACLFCRFARLRAITAPIARRSGQVAVFARIFAIPGQTAAADISAGIIVDLEIQQVIDAEPLRRPVLPL